MKPPTDASGPLDDPPDADGASPPHPPSIIGWLAGTVSTHGDIVEPIDEKWEADSIESDE